MYNSLAAVGALLGALASTRRSSLRLRTIMIADIWSPFLSPEERAAIAGVIAATDAFNGTQPGADA